jgi:hypothetical protein
MAKSIHLASSAKKVIFYIKRNVMPIIGWIAKKSKKVFFKKALL